MDLGLKGRVALVTGGSKGMGREIALTLAKEGADVALFARGAENLEKTSQEVREATGRRCETVRGDVSVLADCQRFVQTAVDQFGRADILVHCANTPSDSGGTLLTIPDEEWISHMTLKFFGAVRCCREIVPHMQKNGWGRIVLVAGMTARVIRLNRMDNGPVCAALSNFGTQLAAQVIRDGIRVNVIHPNATDTPRRLADVNRLSRMRGMSKDAVAAKMVAELPMGRFIRPEEIADLVAFLCSDRSEAITGQSIGIDGGAAKGVYY
jgi:NAD(P)-dependent dehydrogenase (short-subunit alcohol dehydrogenase family)